MPGFTQRRADGPTFFFTLTLRDRRSRLLLNRVDALRSAFAAERLARPFLCDAAVVLPDHLHMIWTLPQSDTDHARRWSAIKARFTRAVGGRDLWVPGYWTHRIGDPIDFDRHIRFCLMDPVRHGLVRRPEDWPHSSIHRDMRRGRIDATRLEHAPRGRYGDIDELWSRIRRPEPVTA